MAAQVRTNLRFAVVAYRIHLLEVEVKSHSYGVPAS
jgi:hypothetical protein